MQYLLYTTFSMSFANGSEVWFRKLPGITTTYKLEDVARSICSSRAEFEANQLAMISEHGGSYYTRG